MTRGILFIGHGTRDAQGLAEFRTLTRRVAKRFYASVEVVEHAFLELVVPDVQQGLQRCIEQGVTRLLLVPLFLFTARHLKHDLPAMVAEVSEAHPDLALAVTPALGNHLAVLEVAALRLKQAGYRNETTAPVVFIGRGNKDPEAQATFEKAASTLGEQFRIPRIRTAYLAGTGVQLETVLEELTAIGEPEVWILPYLLFSGYLTQTLPDRVYGIVRSTGVVTRIAPYLGIHDALVDAIVTQIHAHLFGVPATAVSLQDTCPEI